MEIEKRSLKRKPLSDCTNIPHNSSLIKQKKPSLSTNRADKNSIKYDTTTGTNNAEIPRIQPSPSTPPQPGHSSNSDFLELDKSTIFTVYGRRNTADKRKNRGKAVRLEQSSCPPPGRIRSIGDELNEEHGDVGLSTRSTIPLSKGKKKRRHTLPVKRPLPQDFIYEQRAYFAEIDAFELPVEVVSESELE